MTTVQEGHLSEIKSHFLYHVDTKYRKGQREHGGNLFDLTPLQLVEAALDEAVDQFTYLVTLRDKLLTEKKV